MKKFWFSSLLLISLIFVVNCFKSDYGPHETIRISSLPENAQYFANDVPTFDRYQVQLHLPAEQVINKYTQERFETIGKIIGSVIMNIAKRIEAILEFFKPYFRGIFAIQGLPSDRRPELDHSS